MRDPGNEVAQCIVRILSKKYYGRLEVQNFSSRAEEHFNTQKRNFVSQRGHVLSSFHSFLLIKLMCS